MSAIIDICKWLNRNIGWGAVFLASPFGLFVVAVGSVATAVSSMFSRLQIFQGMAAWVNELTQSLQGVLANNIGDLGQILLYGFGIDRLVQISSGAVALSFGVTVLVFITLFLLVFALVPVMLGVRATLKAVQVLTLGFVQP